MDNKTAIGNPRIQPAGYIDTTTAKMPVVTADKVAVEITGTNALNCNFVSLETKLNDLNEKLDIIANALNAIANR